MQDDRAEHVQGDTPRVEGAVRSAFIWNFATLAFAQVVLAAIFLMLASRLDPATFGIFALASVITDVFYALGTAAAVDAIVQRQDFSRRTLSSITWAMSGICIVMTVIFCAAAPFYASAMGAPRVAGALEVLTLSTLMLPFVIGPTAIMRQKLDVKALALLNMVASLLGGGAALIISFTPAVEWSLVVQRLVMTFSFVVMATARTRLIPDPVISREEVRNWLSSASRIFAGQGIASITPRLADVFTGAFFGATAVGYLRVATRLSDLLMGFLINPVSQLWVTLMSRTAASTEARQAVFLQLTNLMALVALPGFVGLALTANEVVGLVLPSEYAPVAGPLAILCLLGVFVPLTNPRNLLFTALKRFNYLIWFSVLDLVATALCMAVMARFGPVIMVGAGAFTSIIMIMFALPLILRDLKLPPTEVASHLLPPYVAVAAMAACVIAAEPLLATLPIIEALLIKIVIGVVSYSGVLMTFFRASVMQALRTVAAR
jgi:O-antigen/teichoic acid export membrane protein